VEGTPALLFAPPREASQHNTIDNLGFCMENENKVNWNNCIKATVDPNILDLSECYKDPGYRGICIKKDQGLL